MSHEKEYRQIPLRIGFGGGEGTFDSFFVSDANRVSFNYLRNALAEDLGSVQHFIFLYGPKNGGKSHLLSAAVARAMDGGYSAIAMDLAKYRDSAPVSILQGAEDRDVICLDNVDAAAGSPDWETEIFYLYNRWHALKKGLFMVASAAPPAAAGFVKKDLVTRLGGGVTLSIHPVSIADLPKLLVKRESSRGSELAREYADIIVGKLGNVGECVQAVDEIDALAFSMKRGVITKTLVEQVVKSVRQKAADGHRAR